MSIALLYDPNTVKKIEVFSFLRLSLFTCVLVTSIFLKQDVLGAQTLLEIFLAMGITFLLSLLHVSFWEDTLKVSYFIASQLVYDLLLISFLIYLTGVNESVFLFLYLLNIVLAALVYQMYGALLIAFISGVIYALIFYINSDTANQTEVNALLYNELFFLLTALLCGQLMDELKKQRTLLDVQMASIARLEHLNDQLLNNIPVGVMLIDENDYVKTINLTAINLLKLRHSPDILYKYYDLLAPLKGIRETWFQLPEAERLRHSFSLTNTTGQTQSYSFQLVRLEQPEQLKNNLIFMFHDITKIIELEDRVEMETRLAAIGQLAAGIAHEIRNPLASISGSLEMLKANIKIEDEEDKKLIAIALRETVRLNHLITEFLQFARPKQAKFQSFALQPVINEVAEAIQSRIRDMVQTDFQINVSPALQIFGDIERVKQVFFNLFINSVEASTQKNVLISIDANVKSEHIEIIVRDNGSGIDKDIASKIFDPFFTTKPAGTGLGLSTVAQIIKAHKGNIRILPGPGAGFELRFPLTIRLPGVAS